MNEQNKGCVFSFVFLKWLTLYKRNQAINLNHRGITMHITKHILTRLGDAMEQLLNLDMGK